MMRLGLALLRAPRRGRIKRILLRRKGGSILCISRSVLVVVLVLVIELFARVFDYEDDDEDEVEDEDGWILVKAARDLGGIG